ncbi:MAG: hypothetical protein IH571_04680, partial [Acholeplasmataceae bacterium]|nr:hypothetical protein [Acholeplasmataceae bacterium]
MNSFIKHLLLLSISFLLIGCSEKKNSNIDPPIDDQPIVEMTRIPLFEQPFGYASLSISNRTDELNIIQVQDEIEFLDALLLDDGKIIEIQNDLNLGSNYVEAMLLDNDLNLEDFQSVYRSHSRQPLLHPTLLEQGVGQVRIVLRNNLMIYSKDGSTIKHASFLIDGSTDIVFRNLRLSG